MRGLKRIAPLVVVPLCALSAVETTGVGTCHFTTWSQGPKLLILTWMSTWQHFVKLRFGICVETWVEQIVRPNFEHKVSIVFA
jgi:hypothetical protein